jgi:steroid 5-alpha reductase family enzyme
MLEDLIRLALADAALVFGSFTLLWAIGMAMRDSSLVDIWFSPCIALAAIMGVFVAHGAEPRRELVAVLATIWAVRLGGYLAWRNWGREDPRYARFRKHIEDQGKNFAWYSFTRINLYQGAMVFFGLAPIMIAQVAPVPEQLGPLAWAGAALSLLGVALQGIADLQLARFKADPANAGQVLDTGLWRYTRHPNYFGDACVWWGLYLIAAETGPGLASILGPIFLTFTLTKWSGIGITEKSIHSSRPGYADYVRRTSAFIPWPPKRAG